MAAGTFLHGAQVIDIDDGVNTITTVATSIIGLVGTAPNADPLAFPLNTPVVVSGSATLAAKLTSLTPAVGVDFGTLPGAMQDIFDNIGAVVVVVRVAAGITDTATETNIIGAALADGTFTGIQALAHAESTLGYKPRILIAPGYTHQKAADPVNVGMFLANPVVAALNVMAGRLRAVALIDGSNTTNADAFTRATDFDSKRLFLIDPWITVLDTLSAAYVTRPASASTAGLIAATDNSLGYWRSPSNQPMPAVLGLGRPIDFVMGDATSTANLLNAQNITTIVRNQGYRLWGNRTLSSESKWAFLCVVRVADILADSIVAAMLWAVDRNITKNYVTLVVEEVNNYIRGMVTDGAIIGGSCWCDPDLNPADSVAAGDMFFDFEFTPAYPAEDVTFRSHLTDKYVSEIF